ncbi:hypothetical protein R83H12_00811 [Fibrobacteria bacterium R8-3-H12]
MKKNVRTWTIKDEYKDKYKDFVFGLTAEIERTLI